MSDKTYVGRRLSEFESSPAFEPVTRVVLWYDDENSYSAGDDGGRTLELHCPWATQAMADNILAAVAGYVYRPFSGGGAMLDPAAEVGDAVTVNGVYSLLASVDTTFDALCLSDISAPAEQEVDHEYPYQSPQGRELRRKVSLEQKYYGTKISRREGLVIEKTDGDAVEARVVLNADKLAFYDGAGQEQLYFDPAAGCYKFRGALNVNDNFIVAPNGDLTAKGNINLAGNINMSAGVITWGNNGPVKYQFSSAGVSGPWHDTMQTNDKYRRDSLDGGTTWGAGYQFVGIDGQDGSSADVPGYITRTYIDMTGIDAPYIKANLLTIQTPDSDMESGLLLTGYYDHKAYDWLKISYFEGDAPHINITSPETAYINIGDGALGVNAKGRWNFKSANVSGITATFA